MGYGVRGGRGLLKLVKLCPGGRGGYLEGHGDLPSRLMTPGN